MKRPRLSRRSWVATLVVVLAVALIGSYAVASKLAYEVGTTVSHELCDVTALFTGMTPASFETRTKPPGPIVETAPYLMPDYTTVTFPSRDPEVTIAAWWVPGPSKASPAVILVHGVGRCRWDPEVLLPAGMLHKGGFAVLLIDLRNHGGSTTTDGHTSAGVFEHRDVLGAWDWLRTKQELSAGRIGVYGVSLGAATSMIAMGQEPEVAAVWEDSGFSSMESDAGYQLSRKGFPELLAPGVVTAARFLYGVDVVAMSPEAAMQNLAGRPIAIVHGTADVTAPVENAHRLEAAVLAGGGSADLWILPDVTHVRAAFVAPAEYEHRLAAFFSGALGGMPSGSTGR